MANTVGSAKAVLLAWLIAGVLSLIGAFCYAELGSRFPRAGGEYIYLKEAYGPLPAFLFGWMRFWIGSPGSIAAYGVGAATFINTLSPFSQPAMKIATAIGFVLFFSALNCASVTIGGRVQSFLTFLKLFVVVSLASAIFIYIPGSNWLYLNSGEAALPTLSSFGTAMIAALWAYDGWNNMPMAAGEIKDPEKNIPRALIIGMALVLVAYLAINLAYFVALPFADVLSSFSKLNPNAPSVASKAAQLIIGPIAGSLLTGAFVVSALGAMNGSILTGARVPYAMSRDGLFFAKLGLLGTKSRAPIVSVLVQCLIACLLAASGTFDQLTDYVVFASWIFYALVTGSLFIFRRRPTSNDNSNTYRSPFFPILPVVFITISLLLLFNTLVTSPTESLMGLVFILLGVPFYFVQKKLMSPNS